jgi:(2Fe-2S) ferredoxin
MKCIVKIIWDDGVWYSKVSTESGENVRLTLESGSFDALIERVRIAIPEMLELNFGYVGDIQLSFDIERNDALKAVAS